MIGRIKNKYSKVLRAVIFDEGNITEFIFDITKAILKKYKNIKNTLLLVNNSVNFALNFDYIFIVCVKESLYKQTIDTLKQLIINIAKEMFNSSDGVMILYYDSEYRKDSYMFCKFDENFFDLLTYVIKKSYYIIPPLTLGLYYIMDYYITDNRVDEFMDYYRKNIIVSSSQDYKFFIESKLRVYIFILFIVYQIVDSLKRRKKV